MTWMCSCGTKNSGLNQKCAYQNSLSNIDHAQISSNIPDLLMAIVAGKELNLVTPQEELYAQFYNKGKILVADMDVTALREHRDTLSQIAFEAKATLAAADDELRERKAKSSSKSKEWTLSPTGPDANVTDAINAVKIRKERMSKMDKMKSQLLAAGIDEETVKEMISNLERKATEKNLKTVTFNKPVIETSAVRVEVSKPTQEQTVTSPFNPASLFSNK